MKYEFFGSMEAAQLTGVSQDQQRNLRRRNSLPPMHGTRASFTGGGLLFLKILNDLSALGIGPSMAKEIANEASDIAFYYALTVPGGNGGFRNAAPEWKKKRNLKPKAFAIISNDICIYTNKLDTYYENNNDPAVALVLSLEDIGIKMANATRRPFVSKSQ